MRESWKKTGKYSSNNKSFYLTRIAFNLLLRDVEELVSSLHRCYCSNDSFRYIHQKKLVI